MHKQRIIGEFNSLYILIGEFHHLEQGSGDPVLITHEPIALDQAPGRPQAGDCSINGWQDCNALSKAFDRKDLVSMGCARPEPIFNSSFDELLLEEPFQYMASWGTLKIL
jgi:hypothetical protein